LIANHYQDVMASGVRAEVEKHPGLREALANDTDVEESQWAVCFCQDIVGLTEKMGVDMADMGNYEAVVTVAEIVDALRKTERSYHPTLFQNGPCRLTPERCETIKVFVGKCRHFATSSGQALVGCARQMFEGAIGPLALEMKPFDATAYATAKAGASTPSERAARSFQCYVSIATLLGCTNNVHLAEWDFRLHQVYEACASVVSISEAFQGEEAVDGLFVQFDRLKEAGDAAGLLTAANGATLLRMPDKLVETCEAMQ
jgi:hypothetical protein